LLKSIEVKDLFYESNDKFIEFNNDLTIVVGKNGSGKTTLLTILHSIITQSFEKLFNYEFKEVIVKTDYSDIRVLKKNSPNNFQSEIVVNYIIYDVVGDIVPELSHEIKLRVRKENNIRRIGDLPTEYKLNSKYFPTYRRLETDIFQLLADNTYTLNNRESYFSKRLFDDISQSLSDNINGNIILGLSNNDINSIVKSKWNEAIEFEKIQLNKLIKKFMLGLLSPMKNFEPTPISKVNAEGLLRDLEEMFTKAGFIDENSKDVLALIKQYVEQITWAGEYTGKFNKINISDDLENVQKFIQIQHSHSKIDQLIRMYKDTYKKIIEIKKPFKDIQETLKKFDIINEIIDGELVFFKDAGRVEYGDLSAGEKQIVAMAVYTKLSLEENAVVIIDEPELSLHINWQRNFLKYLVSDQTNVQFIISTHSPFIVSGYTNKVFPLAAIGVEDDE
jgi:predicted ATP-binding protein involved in virulence